MKLCITMEHSQSTTSANMEIQNSVSTSYTCAVIMNMFAPCISPQFFHSLKCLSLSLIPSFAVPFTLIWVAVFILWHGGRDVSRCLKDWTFKCFLLLQTMMTLPSSSNAVCVQNGKYIPKLHNSKPPKS